MMEKLLHKPENICGLYVWDNFKDASNIYVTWISGRRWRFKRVRGLREWLKRRRRWKNQ